MGTEERWSASEEEDDIIDDEGGWEDWNDADTNAVGDGSPNDVREEETEVKCLLCNQKNMSPFIAFQHCSGEHGLDFMGLRQEMRLNFYDCLRLMNYIRSQVAIKRCWNCGIDYDSEQLLLNHLNVARHSTLPSSSEWKDDKFLTPFLENDALLYGFEDDMEEADEFDVIDKNAIINELAGSEQTSELMKLVDDLKLDGGASSSKELSSLPEKNIAAREISGPKKKVTFGRVTEREISRVNSNYFGSYGEYGIHREMLADKVRTEAYQKALMNNPTLLKNATVLDIGCGTGILSLFAAKGGASKVVAVDGSDKMASVARQVAKENGFLGSPMTVVAGMIEELDEKLPLDVHGADVIVSEWMGYCLLYESMLGSVLHARDRWLKPGGAMLPDVAELHVAGFGRGGTSLAFWDNVYGFSMKNIGEELVGHASEYPIIDVIDKKDVITETCLLQKFDLVTMKHEDVDFTTSFELKPVVSSSSVNLCYGIVIWFDTGFTSRFCKDEPVVLSTSPFKTSTHWAQTILTFREPVSLCTEDVGHVSGEVGGSTFPAAMLKGRISIARTHKHRSIDVSLETTVVGSDGTTRTLPVQIFDI